MQGRPRKRKDLKKTEMIRIMVKPELKKKLFEIAEERNTTASQLIRDEIDKAIKKTKMPA